MYGRIYIIHALSADLVQIYRRSEFIASNGLYFIKGRIFLPPNLHLGRGGILPLSRVIDSPEYIYIQTRDIHTHAPVRTKARNEPIATLQDLPSHTRGLSFIDTNMEQTHNIYPSPYPPSPPPPPPPPLEGKDPIPHAR
jgi:hypothetical protein